MLNVSLTTIKLLMDFRELKRKKEFMELFFDLSSSARVDLIALMWRGRDPKSDEYFEVLRTQGKDELGDQSGEYLWSQRLLVRYWERGLKCFGILPEQYRCENEKKY